MTSQHNSAAETARIEAQPRPSSPLCLQDRSKSAARPLLRSSPPLPLSLVGRRRDLRPHPEGDGQPEGTVPLYCGVPQHVAAVVEGVDVLVGVPHQDLQAALGQQQAAGQAIQILQQRVGGEQLQGCFLQWEAVGR